MLVIAVSLFSCVSCFVRSSSTTRDASSIVISKASSSSNNSDGDKEKKEKKPWEIGRLFKTLVFFDALPKIRLPFLSRSPSNPTSSSSLRPGSTLWSVDSNALEISWGPLDDVVMGGASKTMLDSSKPFDGVFKGFVTTANNGGFAGIRTKLFSPALDLSSSRGFVLKVKGDGNRYKFIGREDLEWNGIAWSTSFDTRKGQVTEIRIPFTALKPTRFARTIDVGRTFDSKSLTGVQLSLSKFEYDGALNPNFSEGDFSLTLESIKTF